MQNCFQWPGIHSSLTFSWSKANDPVSLAYSQAQAESYHWSWVIEPASCMQQTVSCMVPLNTWEPPQMWRQSCRKFHFISFLKAGVIQKPFSLVTVAILTSLQKHTYPKLLDLWHLGNRYRVAKEHRKPKGLVQFMQCCSYTLKPQLTPFKYLQTTKPAHSHSHSLLTQSHLAIPFIGSIFFHSLRHRT